MKHETLNIPQIIQLDGFFYLASPYSKHPDGLEAAFQEVCRAAGWLIGQGVRVYCPIAHTHPISFYAGMPPAAHEIWLPADQPFINGATGLIVAMMPTWRESYGVQYEIGQFEEMDKPVMYMDWPRKEEA
jgi:hypothetical protein